ncbi:uncharacterized protein LOC124180020 [Neodiprion fabricii]|uniref:uncharacterized protein LOC124180020 n=1 Tax=Neodiprion fabricii TaxID=2872261 RepID=UPI001ED97AC9|nr:uncharacterized protein LOC124180020 [Neodiprion fabricii]
MKIFVCVAFLATLAMAEPPQFRRQRQFFARQQEDTTLAPAADDAPYPPSGWKPAGPAFDLPQRQVDNSYGAPEPPSAYGPPTSTETPTTTAIAEEPTTAPPPAIDSGNELDEEGSGQGAEQQGEYYVVLPDGRLQRVQYVSQENAAQMSYLAKIQAQNVGPIYAYNPLKKVELVSPLSVEAPVALVSPPVGSTSYTTVTTNYQPGGAAKLVFAV